MCSPHTATFPDNNALSNSLRNNLFLDGFNSSPGWLLVTRTRGAWWCRYRGRCRSGPRHLSPRSRVCAQDWHWKDIHSHIYSHTLIHTPKNLEKQQENAQLTKHDAFVYWSSSCAVCWWPIFRKLSTWSTTDALWARTLLTEKICESVQQILQHSPAGKKKTKNKKKNTLNSPNMMPFFTGPLPVQCGGGRRPGRLADATQDCSTSEDFSPRTVLTKNICRCDHHILQHFPNNNALSNSLRNNLFLDSLNRYPGWLLVNLTRGAWWCRYRGHCRSGPRHLSPRSRVCAQEWHWKDIHSHIHSHTPMHTPKKVQKQQQQNAQLTKHDAFVSWSSSCAVCWWPIFRKLGTWSTTDALSARTLLTENICESVQQILQLSPAEKQQQEN